MNAGPLTTSAAASSVNTRKPAGLCAGRAVSLLFQRLSRVSLAGGGAGEEEVAFAVVAGEGGGAFEFGAGFGVAA